MVVSAASWVPNISFLWKQVWIGQWPLQIRHTNKKMTGRLHVHMKISGSYSSDSINLKHNAKIARRQMLLATTGITTAFSVVDFSIAGPYPSMEEPIIPRYYKTASGVKIEDIVEGEGPIAHEGDVVELNYVCRRSNGYFVYSTVDQISGESKPVMLPIDDKQGREEHLYLLMLVIPLKILSLNLWSLVPVEACYPM
ncbi:uncharacterized protein LOC131063791 isoform X2 [Cryptomeria japonica]|uniref:uncharacterized protein LOC131063791 isoform X2 n=1 Tax=Cryptomeria japonica TaxID=3369 RepID=UPI0027DA8779|nr:uncharacterized protein LOC131063791 isoform X2 [Cryptomeria japonica]